MSIYSSTSPLVLSILENLDRRREIAEHGVDFIHMYLSSTMEKCEKDALVDITLELSSLVEEVLLDGLKPCYFDYTKLMLKEVAGRWISI
jgi:hypothetical protein